MAFIPYQIVADRLPKLKAGHIFKIGEIFYEIAEVRRDRVQFVEAVVIPVSPPKRLNTTQALPAPATYTPIVGDLDNARIVHLQYVSFSTVNPVTLYWGVEPMLSKAAALPLQSILAGLTAPFEIDKWTYNEAMNIGLSGLLVAPQTLTFEVIEYAVKKFVGTPPRYLELLPNGEGVFRGY